MSVDTAYGVDDGFDDDGLHDAGRRRRWPLIVFGVVLVLVAVIALGANWVKGQVNPSGPPGAEIHVTIPPGQSTSSIAKILQDHDVIGSATVFRYYARFSGAGDLKAGEFTFHHNQHLAAVIKILQKGGQAQNDRVTIPEGLTLAEIAAKVGTIPGRSADRFLAAAKSGTIRSQFQPPGSNNLEGLILPDTYFVDRTDDEAKILTRMVTAFDTYSNEIGLPAAAAALNLTPYEVVTTASLVEREAGVDEDRPLIARVIYNRIKKGMPLQIDATVQYALGVNKKSLTIADTKVNSPYNTYQIKGLPPGPIASPGRKSLAASLNPPPSTYLYYVLIDKSGKHAFATTDAEFSKLAAEATAKGLR
ncbi:MAG: endolytic transglycosylase MltG [Actinomycetota bacterium]|nr:endolytic transglycosylase MltG [Actinomycetota bacterium]